MTAQELKENIKKELPEIIKTNEQVHDLIADIVSKKLPGNGEAESRFERILEELKNDRIEQRKKWDDQNRKWDEQNKKWDEQNRKWDEQNSKWYEQNRKWDEQNRKWDEQNSKWYEQNRKWDEQNSKWDEQNRKWDENQKVIHRILDEIEKTNQRLDSSIGALGARWGIYSEESFRNGLRAILEDSFHAKVINVNEWDEEGFVFGHPDQVELDIIIISEFLIICEIKSSMSKSDVNTFKRKVQYYEDRHHQKCDRMLIISPMVDDRGKEMAKKWGIEVYSHAYDVRT